MKKRKGRCKIIKPEIVKWLNIKMMIFLFSNIYDFCIEFNFFNGMYSLDISYKTYDKKTNLKIFIVIYVIWITFRYLFFNLIYTL